MGVCVSASKSVVPESGNGVLLLGVVAYPIVLPRQLLAVTFPRLWPFRMG